MGGSRDWARIHVHARPQGGQDFIYDDWSLGDGRTGILENMSVALEQVNASLQ